MSVRRSVALVAVVALSLAAGTSHAAMVAYMTVRGQKQGEIRGSVTQKGREGKIAVIAMSHDILSPRDAQSGMATGRRMHKPLVVTIEWDRSLPQLYTALTTNENLQEVIIDFYSPQLRAATGTGSEVNDFTIRLTNANIASISARMQNARDPETQKYEKTLEIAFTYQKIQWMNKEPGGGTSQDDWESRASIPSPSVRRVAVAPPSATAAAAALRSRRVRPARHSTNEIRLARAH